MERIGAARRISRDRKSRRDFLQISAGALAADLVLGPMLALGNERGPGDSKRAVAARRLVERVLPLHTHQMHFEFSQPASEERFRISGSEGDIHVQGSTTPALLMGLHWYLKYVAGVSTSWSGDCLQLLPAKLPAVSEVIERGSNGAHRFALNDTNDGYTGPYWDWPRWEKFLDVLALHGMNEVLVYMGAEAVYQRCFKKFGYSDEEMRAWLPTPAHQPWWLLQNLSAWVGPSVPQHVIDGRLVIAQKICARLRELEMQPVLPGYFGMVPEGFEQRNAGAHVIPQGEWLGLKRPGWLDPNCDAFAKVAAEYYRAQKELLGPARIFKMDPLHEGGQEGGVDLSGAASHIEAALETANPGALWAILGWQKNPRRQVLDGIRDKSHAIIYDGQADRYGLSDREQEWDGTPYTFGTIWNFGGHTTMGANVGVWNERYFKQLRKAGSKLNGIAVMPEASCNNPAAFAFMAELPWRTEPVNLDQWFAGWAAHRYGRRDAQAARAWQVLGATAYNMPSGKWSEAHDNLFSARPALDAKSACSWSPQEARYDLEEFAQALMPLLKVDESLSKTSAYKYDLVDVARQTIANHSRVLLPRIDTAYRSGDLALFRGLTAKWLKEIELLDRLAALEPSLSLGGWIAASQAMAATPEERLRFEFDASSLLLEWGPESSRDSGVHDYANREWNGLLAHYRDRWSTYFAMLDASLERHEPLHAIDWFALDQEWALKRKQFPAPSRADVRAGVQAIYEQWRS
jgi:hypothetical protein